MSMQAIDIASWTVEKFEKSRQNLLDKFKDISEKIEDINSKSSVASQATDTYERALCDEKIASLDVLAFVEIEVFDNDIDNHLFGEISKIIEDAVDDEVEEMVSAETVQDYKRQLTPSRLQRSCELEKSTVLSDEILVDSEAAVTIRCMEIYDDMCLSAAAVSERSRKKQNENQNLLYIINSKYRFQQDLAENHANESVLYTIALVSAVKDGSKPSLSEYKEKVISNLNKGINALVSSDKPAVSIKVFNTAHMTLDDCKRQLDELDTPAAKNTKLTIEAIQDVYKEKTAEIEKLYESQIE